MADGGIVEVYCGVMGSGKSYRVVQKALDYVASGGCVFTNMKLEIEPWYNERYQVQACGCRKYLKDRYGWDLQEGQINLIDMDEVTQMHTVIPKGTVSKPVLVVVDEALDDFDSLDRDQSKGKLRDVLTWIRHIRKLNIDVCFIAHEFGELNNRIRSKASAIFQCRDMRKTPIPGIGISLFFLWPYFTYAQFSKTGKTFINTEWVVKDKSIWGCYRTDQLFRDIKTGADRRTDFSRIEEKKKGLPMYIKAAACLALVLSIVSVYQINTFIKKSTKQTETLTQMVSDIATNKPQVVIADIKETIGEVKDQAPPKPSELPYCNYGLATIGSTNYFVLYGQMYKKDENVPNYGVLAAFDEKECKFYSATGLNVKYRGNI
jgi:hypothetical protein